MKAWGERGGGAHWQGEDIMHVRVGMTPCCGLWKKMKNQHTHFKYDGHQGGRWGSVITPFLTCPQIAQDPTRRETDTTLTIDYSRSWLRMSDEYIEVLHEKAKKKKGGKRRRREQDKKKEMESTKQKRQEEKVQLEADKWTRKGGHQTKLWWVVIC